MKMKESLKLFGVTSAGFEDANSAAYKKKSDDEVFEEANNVKDLQEREAFLRKILQTLPVGYVKSKGFLAELIKEKDPHFACDLILSACKYSPTEPNNYLLFSKIAISHKAWIVAKSSLEAAKWLSPEKKLEIYEQTELLLKMVLEKINSGEKDNSTSEFWNNKAVSKYWVLERLYYQSDIKQVSKFVFNLLNSFNNDQQNYDVAFKAILLTEDKEAFKKFIEYLNNNLNNDKLTQSLYLGMSYYELSDYESSNKYLREALKIDRRNTKALFYLALTLLMKNNIKDFIATYESIIPIVEPMYIAVHFICSALCNYDLGNKEFPNQKNISREIVVILTRLLNGKQKQIILFIKDQFKKLNYQKILPFLSLYLAQMFIKYNMLDLAKEQLKDCSDFEVHRLYAWIYRLEGKDELAEKELVEYRKNWLPSRDSGIHCKNVGLNLPEEPPGDLKEIFKIVTDAYRQTKELIRNIDLEYGINAMTCIETGCQDCCKKTFPYVSYTEYLYMRDWLEKQPEEHKKNIYESSKKIVSLYKEKYKKEPPFVIDRTSDSRKEYPLEFRFDCPFLGDNKCNVYDARPYTCRAYGYGSSDGISFKGCSYFYEQIKGATKLTDVRRVLDMQSFFNFSSKTDKMLIGKTIVAPIPVWFACSHEENLKKIKQLEATVRA